MSAFESGLSHWRSARKMRSDDPAPTRIFSGATLRASAMASTNPSQPVGGEVRNNQGKNSFKAASAVGEGSNHASRTSALMIVPLRSKASNFGPMASKNAPPWKQVAG